MKRIYLKEKTIQGLSTRTNNSNEFDPKTSKIGKLHHTFDTQVTVNYKEGARVYAIYYDFASDMHGDYTVLAGTDTVESTQTTLEEVHTVEGEYLCFKAKGEVPAIVFEAWQKVWDYFQDAKLEAQRAYTTDFEYYKSTDEIEIYISMK